MVREVKYNPRLEKEDSRRFSARCLTTIGELIIITPQLQEIDVQCVFFKKKKTFMGYSAFQK